MGVRQNEKAIAKTNKDLLKLIDKLAVELANHGHTWSNELRKTYEGAVAFLSH